MGASLLDPFEYKDAKVEIEFFRNNPSLGEYLNWIIVGDLVGPDVIPEPKRRERALNISGWQPDNLPSKMTQIHAMLDATYDIPRVIYMHCEAGMDRTGGTVACFQKSRAQPLLQK